MKTMLPVLFFTILCAPLLSYAGSTPVLDFSTDRQTGCLSLTATFTDQTFTDPSDDFIAYTWNFGDGTVSTVFDPNPVHTYALPGVYDVTMSVVSRKGWTGSLTKNGFITVGSNFSVNIGPDQILCDGSSITLSCGNPAADVIAWNTGENTPDITIYDGGMYTVSVTKDGCTAKDSVNITWKPELWSDFGYAKVGGCLPVDMQFTDSSTSCSGTVIGWLWDFGDGNTSVAQNPVHTFTSRGQFPVRLTVTGGSGSTISHTKRVIIDPPALSVNLGPDTTICFGESLIIDAANPGATYSWNTGDTAQQITVFDNGAYTVTVGMDGCEAKDTINIKTSVSALPDWGCSVEGNCLPVGVSFSDSSSAFCGQSVTSWNWDFGDGTTSALRNPAHSYMTADSFNVRLTITSSGGSTASKTKKLTINNTTFNVSLPSSLKVCRGGSIALDAGVTGAQYAWTPTYGLSASNVRNPTLVPTSNSWYKVAVTKCSIIASDSVYIAIDSTVKPVIIQQGNSLKSSAGATYQWYLEGKLIGGATSKSIRVDKAGYYTVKITNGSGCINASEPYFYVPVSGDEKTTGSFRIKCSPNPTRGIFNILLSDIPDKPAMVTLFDATGKGLLVTSIQDHVTRMDIAKFSKGLYFLQIVINTDRRIIPVIIQ